MPGTTQPTTQPSGDANYDEFASVFDELMDSGATNEGTTEGAQTDDAGMPAANAEQPNEPADGAGDPAQSAAPGADPAVGDGAGPQDNGSGEPAGGEPEPAGVDLAAQLAALQAELAALRQLQPTATPEPTPAPTAAPEPEVYTAAEKEELANLQKDWPDIHRLVTLMARQVQVDTLNYAFSEVGRVIAPLQETVGNYTTSDHMAAIREAHEDYDALYQPCMNWIEQQPSFLKAAYQNVVKQGTAEEVVTMIQRFKDETKWQAPAAAGGTPPAAAPAPAPAAQPTGLSEAAKKAAQAMGAVGTKRAATAATTDPTDFDGAWEEALQSDLK